MFMVKETLRNGFGPLFDGDVSHYDSNIHPLHDRELEKVVNKLKITWKAVADQSGLLFHHNISPISFVHRFEAIGFPLNLYFPNYALDSEDCHKLLNTLKEYSTSQQVIIQIYTENYTLVNQLCPIEKMIQPDEKDALPNGYILDENLDWMIYTDYYRDLQMTILGGSKKLIDSLKLQTGLEIVECPFHSRVDHFSDNLN